MHGEVSLPSASEVAWLFGIWCVAGLLLLRSPHHPPHTEELGHQDSLCYIYQSCLLIVVEYGGWFNYAAYMWSLKDDANTHVIFFEDMKRVSHYSLTVFMHIQPTAIHRPGAYI